MSKAAPKGSTSVRLIAIPDIPEIHPGDDISGILLDCLSQAGIGLRDGDIIGIAHKVISKAEGRFANLKDVEPGRRAKEVAQKTKKDPRLVELILAESDEISRMREGVLIVRHRLGFTSANAGIDRSNVPQSEVSDEWVVLLPIDPDRTAAEVGGDIQDRTGMKVGVIIVDSHGRPFRLGTVGVAIGVYGIPALWDRRGESDLYGFELKHTEVGTADEIAAAASLLMGQAAEGQPAVLIRGLELPLQDGKARDLIRPKAADLYRNT